MTTKKKRGFRLTRDSFVFLFGVLGLLNETLRVPEPREVLVLLFGGMVMGVPLLRAGDKEHDRREEGGDDKP